MTDPSLDRRVCEITGVPSATQYVETAIAALEAMREKGWDWEISAGKDGETFACVIHVGAKAEDWAAARANTLTLAICRAIVATQEEK